MTSAYRGPLDRLVRIGAIMILSTCRTLNSLQRILCFVLLFWVLPLTNIAFSKNEPWEGTLFSGNPESISRAAAAIPSTAGASVVVLLDEKRFVFDDLGRSSRTEKLVYRILTPKGVDELDSVQVLWAPWYQERPSIRVRVITPDFAVHILDQKTLNEGQAHDESPKSYIDERVLEGPLPAVEIGAVVEREIVTTEKIPFFDKGCIKRVVCGRPVPVQQARVIIDAPTALPLRYLSRLLPAEEPVRKEASGRVELTFETGPLSAIERIEPFLPSDVPRWPYIAFSTGDSWQAVAARYAQIVEGRIHPEEVRGLVSRTLQGKKDRMEVIASLVARLHKETRYTGVEFGQSSIVPQPAAEILKRKYGDCKDKSLLLVSMLRAAGIQAQMALLLTGHGQDLDKELPGMGMFSHVIVRVPGTPALWIDATDEYARVGQLPTGDKGRLALVVDPNTTALIPTPESTSSDNRLVETREFHLSELGPARVIETSETWGLFERNYRSTYSGSDSNDERENLEDYVKQTYLAKRLEKLEVSDPNDFDVPFRIRLEAAEAGRGITDEKNAVVAIRLNEITHLLPAEFSQADSSEISENSSASLATNKSNKSRTADYVLFEPFINEWHYRIIPPPGYKPQALPASVKEDLGPASLSRQFSVSQEGVVRADFRFDTAKSRFTPAEVETLRVGIKRLEKGEPIILQFEQVGESWLTAGKIREALREFKSLAALHPNEGLHHAQIARTLLTAGLGEAAREEARLGVQLDPQSVVAYQTLALVLQYDLVGRQFKKGFDMAGAENAFRKAKALDPLNSVGIANLAILLEHDEKGIRYGPKSRLNEAISEYQSIKENLSEAGVEANLPVAMMWARRFKDLMEMTQGASVPSSYLSYRLVAIAATEGSETALKEALRALSSDALRRSTLLNAAELLMQLRFYPQAADLMAAGAQGTANAANTLTRVALLRTLRRHDEFSDPQDDPRTAVKKLFRVILDPDPMPQELLQLMSHHSRQDFGPEEEKELQERMASLRRSLASTRLLPDLLLDLILGVTQMTVEGGDTVGYRIRMQGPGMSGTQQNAFYVTKEERQYRLLGGGWSIADAGMEVLERVEKGDLLGARRLLDWIREDETLGGGDDPLSGSVFARFWSKGVETDKDAIRSAAATLLVERKMEAGKEAIGTGAASQRAQRKEAKTAIPILTMGREAAKTDAARQEFDLALAQAFGKAGENEKLLPVAQRLLASAPDSLTAFHILGRTLTGLKRWTDAEKLAEARLERHSDDPHAIRLLASIADKKGELEKTSEYLLRLVKSGKAEAPDFNNLAWNDLIRGQVIEEALQVAQRSALLSQNKNAAALHTLASLYAEVGKTAEARDVALQSLEVSGQDDLNSQTWYVLGRIAEQYGFNDAAAANYRKVEQPRAEESTFSSCYLLAQRRLKAMNASR